jgi:hypothetical protein
MGDGLIAERKLPNPSTFESGIVGNLGTIGAIGKVAA